MKLEAKVYRRNKKGEVFERDRVLPRQSSTYLSPYSLTSRVESGTKEGLDAALKLIHDCVVDRVNTSVKDGGKYSSGLLANSIVYTADNGKTIKGMNEGGGGVHVKEAAYTREVKAGLPTSSKEGIHTGFVGTFVSPMMGEGLPATIRRRVRGGTYTDTYEGDSVGSFDLDYDEDEDSYIEIPNPDLSDDYQYASIIEFGGNVRHEYTHEDGTKYVRIEHIAPHAFFRGGVDDAVNSEGVLNLIKSAVKKSIAEAIAL